MSRRTKRRATSFAGVADHAFTLDSLTTQAEAPIHVSAEYLSGDARRIYREEVSIPPPPALKRVRLTEPSPAPAEPTSDALADNLDGYDMRLDDYEESEPPQDSGPKPARVVKPSDPVLHEWMHGAFRDIYLEAFIWRDGRGKEGDSAVCRRCKRTESASKYRCRECAGGLLVCQECCVDQHLENPLHVIEEWQGAYFSKRTLKDLGLVIQFGHRPRERCGRPHRGHSDFVVLHENGIHEVAVAFCDCEHRAKAGPPYVQLLRAGWFPSTHKLPQTCATFICLDRFHALSLQSKTTAYDFYAVLERLTDGTGVKPPNRYQVFLRMARQYRHLLLLKRAGRGHEPGGVAGTAPGELAIRCPACPRPGVNLPDDWQNASPEDRCLYIIFLALDACFKLKRRMISSELKDPGLGTGWAYMVEPGPYRAYLRTVTDQNEISTCTGLAALDYANTKFSTGFAATGVGMGVCARHEFVQPNGVGDLQKGERYANMDYIFASLLRHIHRLLRKIISYDIVCQWWKNLLARLEQLPPLVRLTIVLSLYRFVIPKLHILSHRLKCQTQYSLNLVPGGGQTDGEGIERPWAMIGAVAASTRVMGPGARGDHLDDHWTFWNWTKLIGLASVLRRRLDTAKVELQKQQDAFEAFSVQQSERVPLWRAMVDAFEADGSQKNPYETEVKGLSEMAVRKKFEEEESREKSAQVPRVHDVSPSSFIGAILDLEEDQRRIRVQAELKRAKSTAMQINLRTARRKLNQGIERLRALQATYTPAALVKLQALNLDPAIHAEDIPLLPPSALSELQRSEGGCRHGLVELEKELRDAQCRTALAYLRNQLQIKTRLLIYTKHQSRHQGMNTRSQTIVARNESKIRLHSDKYQAAWRALVAIEGGEARVSWRRLKREDIRCMEDPEALSKKEERRKRAKARELRRRMELVASGEDLMEDSGDDEEDASKHGESRREVSWIFTVAGVSGTDAELEDALRIEWCKAFARKRRWDEDVRILTAEGERLPLSFMHEANRWLNRAKAVKVGEIDEEYAEGLVAYAIKKADMYKHLVVRAELTRTEPKLRKGQRRQRAPACSEFSLESREEEEEEEEGLKVDTDDEEAMDRGDYDSEEELVLGGELDD